MCRFCNFVTKCDLQTTKQTTNKKKIPMNNFGNIFSFVFLYLKIADIERNWSVADESSNVSDSQFASDIIASINNNTAITTTTNVSTIPTTTMHNDAGRSENMESSADTLSSIGPDSLRSGLINSTDNCSENA